MVVLIVRFVLIALIVLNAPIVFPPRDAMSVLLAITVRIVESVQIAKK
jgi:hypothetical protein